MNYDINEKQTSIDNMFDTLQERLKVAAIRDNIGNMKAIHDEWIVDGQDPEDLGLNIEKNFAGTFIGSISQFKFYACNLSWVDIENNYNQEKARYGL